jgi:hypothetical protein
MATTTIIPLHAGGRAVATALGLSIDYIENPDKTEQGEWVTAYCCDPLIADKEFAFSKNQYALVTGRSQGTRDVIGYHLRISFKPGETDAPTANKIGYELAMKLTHGNHAFVCCTHVDKAHVHSHIVINSTSLDCARKFRNFKGSAFAIRKIADHLCLENGLSIIEKPRPSRGSYANWQGDAKPPTNREKLEQMIDAALENAKDFEAFIAAMRKSGCEVKRGKHLAFKIPGAERFARCKSLGDDYSEEAIRERISGKRTVKPRPKTKEVVIVAAVSYRPSLLIDIQTKLQQAHSPGFEHYATIYNLKEIARTLIYLKDKGIDSYSELKVKANSATSDFNDKQIRIKEIESRQKEISELQKQIGTYSKTKDYYAEYNKLKKYQPTKWEKFRNASHPADDYYEVHRADIILCEAAKKHFNEQGYGKNKKLPSIQTLKTEYAVLEKEKRQLYGGHKDRREEMIGLKTALQNVDMFLGEPPQLVKNRSHDRSR